VQSSIAANPDALLKLKQLEADQQVKLTELSVQAEANRLANETAMFQAQVDDTKSARELAAKQDGDWLRPTIAIMLVSAVIGITIAVFIPSSREVMKDNVASNLLCVIVGYVFSEFKSVMNFLFGTSRDAQRQSTDIARFAMSPGAVTLTQPSDKDKQ
jgi:hypothetical protein